ncbi:ankyrin repeat domain-containing protein 29 isoform X2 [Mastomys coucha]|uniref:ankyrin repeat domain-containing protein 29 isoform X2 n=1 Tax=Mastomys coucha TaxID=35658 RepID=UPI0012629065|nr:ankyrin repeat domain-containing protein 29 isoform X2 [Mastomys coucha]
MLLSAFTARTFTDSTTKLYPIPTCVHSPQKETPLANAAFWAAKRGNLALLKLLLNSGRVDVDCRDSVRRDAVSACPEHAFALCRHELLQILSPSTRLCTCSCFRLPSPFLRILRTQTYRELQASVNCHLGLTWVSVDQFLPRSDKYDGHGTTLLMVASYAGHIDCVRELVLQGADINLQRESGTTALFFAAQQGHNDVVRFLFGFGASTECRTKDGGTALLAASQYGHMPVVETLLKHGANIHDQLYDGATALFLAAQGGYLDVIRLLLSSGAKVNQPRQDGTAPLWIASQMGHSEVVRVMLLRGADRDAARNDGTTALLKAANKGYNDVIEELLKFSPTLGILKNGTSALHAAVLSGNVKTVALLLEAGADPALRNKDGNRGNGEKGKGRKREMES